MAPAGAAGGRFGRSRRQLPAERQRQQYRRPAPRTRGAPPPAQLIDLMAGTGRDALIVFTPSGKRGRFAIGTPVLQAARALGVDIDSVCGGRAICGRCQVTLSARASSPSTASLRAAII